MAGYNYNKGMSNNAVYAYEVGRKPKSRWTKTDIVNEIRQIQSTDGGLNFDLNILNQVCKDTVKQLFLARTEWHHTGSFYNETDFYEVSIDSSINNKKIIDTDTSIKKSYGEVKVKKNARASWMVWDNNRKHPHIIETVVKDGYIEGDWFYYLDGNVTRKKSIYGKNITINYSDEIKGDKEWHT